MINSKTQNIRVRVEDEIRKTIDEICEELGVSMSQFIRDAVEEKIFEYRKENK